MTRCHMTHAYISLAVLAILAGDPLGGLGSAAPPSAPHQGPPLSGAARFSRFAREHHLRAADLTRLHTDLGVSGIAAPRADLREADQANADWN